MSTAKTSLAVVVVATTLACGLSGARASEAANSAAAAPVAVPPSPAAVWPPVPPTVDLASPAAVAAPTANAQPSEPSPAAAATPAPPPVFALAEELTERLKRDRLAGGEREDRDAVANFYTQRQGAPLWVGENGPTDQALAVMTEIRGADRYGLQASAFKLPQVQPKGTAGGLSRGELADFEATLTLSALKYARQARGGRLDPQALSKNFDRKPQLVAPGAVLAALAKAEKPAATLRGFHPQHPQFEQLRLKLVAVRAGEQVVPAAKPAAVAPGKKAAAAPQPPSAAAIEKRLLANMEMWRWMPEFSDYYIINNIPEFTTRMVRGGKTVHLERIVTGKTANQTPLFSNEMQFVVFKPVWNVPESIKWKELQPQLASNPASLARSGLRAAYNGRDIDPASVDWAGADMRQFHIYQAPGDTNVLGKVKFLFPNKHDVYMHDTNQKALFNQSARAFSHGCMRVREPLRFAELLLSQDKGWDMAKVQQLALAGPDNNEIKLTKKVPIHVTYFTTWVDDDGSLKTFSDIYQHESKIQLGLEGKAHLIVQPKEEVFTPGARRQQMVKRNQANDDPVGNWVKQLFSF